MLKYTSYIFAAIITAVCMMYSCQKELDEGGLARGSLKDASGICYEQIVHGTFYNGITAGPDTAFVEVKVNVTNAGHYTIFTSIENGLSFSASGNFVNTGIQSVRLAPSGIPLNNEFSNFSIHFDTSECTFGINVHDSAQLHPKDTSNNNWKFTDARLGVTYKGTFVNNYMLDLGTLKVLVLATKEPQHPGDSTFMINIGLPTGIIEPGNYSTDNAPTGIVFKTFSDACLNCAGGGLIPLSTGATVTITINSYDESTKTVTGHFSGNTVDFNNNVAEIKAGEFTAVLQ